MDSSGKNMTTPMSAATMPHHHVIVGDGITAAEFASTRSCRPDETITIIGPNVEDLGRGVAYAKAPTEALWRYAYLLNSPARSVDPDFAQWITDHWESMEQTMSGRFPDWLKAAKKYSDAKAFANLNAPREIFGDFIHAKTQENLSTLRCDGVHIKTLTTRVGRIEPSSSGISVYTTDNQRIDATSVDVATGGPRNQRFEGDNGQFSFPQLFGNEASIAQIIKADGSIVCIGASAAMLDCLRFCQSVQPESSINFTAINSSGKIFPALRPALTFNPTHYEINGTFDSADAFLSTIIQLQRQALASGDSFYETRVGLRALFMQRSLTQLIPNITEARKVSNPLFNYFEGGTRDSIDDFNRLEKSGHSRILAGRVSHIKQVKEHACVHYTDSTNQPQILSANVIVNCAGPGSNPSFDSLTNDMLAKGWISTCAQSGGILVGEGGQTKVCALRYLGPAVTSIGDSVEPVPLYDAFRLRSAVQKFNRS